MGMPCLTRKAMEAARAVKSDCGYCVLHLLGDGVAVFGGGVGALLVFVHLVHGDEHALAIGGVVERFGGLGAAGVVVGVLLVEAGFHLGALGQALPVAAELVVDEGEGGAGGEGRVGVELDDALELAFVELRAEVGFLLVRAGEVEMSSLVELPADVGGAEGGLGGEGRVGEVVG